MRKVLSYGASILIGAVLLGLVNSQHLPAYALIALGLPALGLAFMLNKRKGGH